MHKSSSFERPAGFGWISRLFGPGAGRNLFWSWYEPRNFGDWIGPYLFEAFTGVVPRHAKPERWARSGCYFFAGSILRKIAVSKQAIVWGSGIISRSDEFAAPRQVLCVRGPESRKRLLNLGYDCPERYGDPGLLLPAVYQPQAERTAMIGIIPHYIDFAVVSEMFGNRDGFRVIDVTRDVESVVEDIVSCDMAVSSSLHGLVVAHAYGVPAAWAASVHPLMGDGVKFADYFGSLGMDEPAQLPMDAVLGRAQVELACTLPDVTKAQRDLLETSPIGGPQ